MTAGTIETARDGGGHGESLRGSPMNASAQGVLGEIMSPKRSNTPCAEQKTRLPISRSVINSSERPMAVIREIPVRQTCALLCRTRRHSAQDRVHAHVHRRSLLD